MGATKLLTAAGGGITLDAASTATDKTITIPAVTATVLTDSAGVLNIGSGQVYKDASGNVGIGTSSPATKLHVSGGSSGTAATFEVSDPAGRIIRIESPSTSGNGFIGTTTNHSLYFRTNNTDRAIIDTSGNLLVGTTSSSSVSNGGLLVLTGTATGGYIGHQSGTSSGAVYLRFDYAGAGAGSITQSGTTAVAYNTTSDYRLKENVQPLSGALDRIAALKPCTYTWKSAPDEIGEGFIAHELAEVCPQAVTGEKDAVNEDGSIKPQSIDTSFLVATLTAAIQEQQAMIASQAEQISSQAAVINNLTERLSALENK